MLFNISIKLVSTSCFDLLKKEHISKKVPENDNIFFTNGGETHFLVLVQTLIYEILYMFTFPSVGNICFLEDPGKARGCSTNSFVIH